MSIHDEIRMLLRKGIKSEAIRLIRVILETSTDSKEKLSYHELLETLLRDTK